MGSVVIHTWILLSWQCMDMGLNFDFMSRLFLCGVKDIVMIESGLAWLLPFFKFTYIHKNCHS